VTGPETNRPGTTRPGTAFVHPSAVIDAGAVLGQGVRVWHFAHVSAGASVGEGTVLGQGVYVGPGVKIGKGCKVQNHVSVYEGVTLEDEVFVGPNAVFTNVLRPRAHVNRRAEFLPTLIRRRATIGANATILCGRTLGEGSFVAAASLVTHDVPPRVLVKGVPARATGFACDCGEPLPGGAHGDTAADLACTRCGATYGPAAVGEGLRRLGPS
jgi:UDP-2-acetamido-3-amino-2,3-dideoxy-glucuronate N-acetyltransferase